MPKQFAVIDLFYLSEFYNEFLLLTRKCLNAADNALKIVTI
jgi:hypothetical protein